VAGDRLDLVLGWGGDSMFARRSLEQRLEATRAAWRGWLDCFHYSGPREPLVRRSAITLKLCDHLANGAMVAAATSSLPEAVGGTRNWDYRYTWIRDAAFSVYALRRVGLASEAWAFLAWVLALVQGGSRPAVLYDVDGRVPAEEWIDPQLEGYRAPAPVRWGNAAGEHTSTTSSARSWTALTSGPQAAGS
jgi:alpha,alpha-trehalase